MKKIILTIAIFAFLQILSISVIAQSLVISTIAGNGHYSYDGDDSTATIAQLYNPNEIARDAAGNIYIADAANNRIRKINTSGIITTIAGNGKAGFTKDNGLADTTELNNPTGVAVDALGNVFIADRNNQRIRKINTSGIISTIAGDGTAGYIGDNGVAKNAELDLPTGVAVDALGNVYIADYFNSRIREISSNVIYSIAGNGTSGYSGNNCLADTTRINHPLGVAVDVTGNVYFADSGNNLIRKITTNGYITIIAGGSITVGVVSITPGYSGDGGAAISAKLNNPTGVAVDTAGNIYIADYGNDRIRKVNTSGIISTIAGNGTAGFSADGGLADTTELNHPFGICLDASGYVYIADEYNNRVREINSSGIISTIGGNGLVDYSGDGATANAAELHSPQAIAIDASGNIYIADEENNRIRKVSTSGIITTIAGDSIQGFSGDGGLATSAELNYPTGVALDAAGNVYIADQYNNRIREINSSGIIATIAGNGSAGFSGDGGIATSASLNHPSSIAFDAAGNLYIADEYNNCIRKIKTNGIISTFAGSQTPGFSGDGGLATNAKLATPIGVTTDAVGNVYIADYFNNRIRKVNAIGIISTIAGNGTGNYSGDGRAAINAELNYPSGVAVDGAGNVFIADEHNQRIREINTNDTIATIAGNGTAGFSGDGGAPTAAELNYPSAVALDASGNLYIADYRNNRIRELSAPTGIVENNFSAVSINIFPNPSNGIFNIVQENHFQKSSLEIYNLLGEKIISTTLNTSQTQINLSGNAKGIYFYKVVSEDRKNVSNGELVVQ